MKQMHKGFTAEQVKVLFKAYCQGILDRPAVQETLATTTLLWINHDVSFTSREMP